jgi:surfeit locus 1 family protein
MPIRFSALGRVFAPSWPMTLLTLVLLMSFVSLGRWQWQRGEDRQRQREQFEQAPTPVLTATAPDFDSLPRFGRVAFAARFQPAHQFLLDNRTHAGKPGFEVLTPARLDNGDRVLVNRGWIPFTGFRDRLPDVSLQATGTATIVGRVDELPSPGLASGRAPPDTSAQWPKLTSFPTHEELQRALGEKISRRVVLLDPRATGYGDFVREWSPPGLAPERHFSYAIQWWGFSVVLLVLYFGLNFRKVS